MDAELSEHLGYERGQAPPGGAGNARNGVTEKTVHSQHGSVRIEQPRDRRSSFEPQIVPKHNRRFSGFDERSSPCTGATSRRTWQSCTASRSATT